MRVEDYKHYDKFTNFSSVTCINVESVSINFGSKISRDLITKKGETSPTNFLVIFLFGTKIKTTYPYGLPPYEVWFLGQNQGCDGAISVPLGQKTAILTFVHRPRNFIENALNADEGGRRWTMASDDVGR